MVRATNDTSANSVAIKRFTAFLESRQLRKTPERFAILQCALSFARHFTIDDVSRAMEQQCYHVSRTTLYSTLDLLIESEIIRKHVFEGLLPQYERAMGHPHSHLVCTECGKVKEVRDVNLVAFMNARKYNAFTASHYSVTVYGMCSACARKLKRVAK